MKKFSTSVIANILTFFFDLEAAFKGLKQLLQIFAEERLCVCANIVQSKLVDLAQRNCHDVSKVDRPHFFLLEVCSIK